MTTQPNTLQRIAVAMYAELAADPRPRAYTRRLLFGGLQVLLERNGDQRRLAIARLRQAPSRQEAETVARDFDVPPGTEWSWIQKPFRGSVGRGAQPKVIYSVAECTWREVQSPKSEVTTERKESI